MRYFMDECGEVPDECWKTVLAEDGRSFGILERSMVCTNAYIEGYLRHVYNPPNSETHIWNRFDIVEAVQMIISSFAAAS